MTNITDILAMDPRYAQKQGFKYVVHYSPVFGEHIAPRYNRLKDADINAAKAILGKKMAEVLEEAIHMLTRDYIDPDKRVTIERCEAALAEWNKLEGNK